MLLRLALVQLAQLLRPMLVLSPTLQFVLVPRLTAVPNPMLQSAQALKPTLGPSPTLQFAQVLSPTLELRVLLAPTLAQQLVTPTPMSTLLRALTAPDLLPPTRTLVLPMP